MALPDRHVTTRVDLREEWARSGVGPAVVVPASQSGVVGVEDNIVAQVVDRLTREHADLMSQELLRDPFAADRVRSAIRAQAQTLRVSPLEIERVVRRVEGQIFSLGDLAEVLSDPEVMEIQMIGPDYATSRRQGVGLGRDPRVRFHPSTDPVKELKHFADFYGAKLDETEPYATFMAGPWRVSIHIPPHIVAPFSLTMRRSVDEEHKLVAADFLRLGTVDRRTLDILYALVDSYQTMLTFAPQRSGKTQLQRILIDHMNPDDGAIVLLEDIPEIRPSIPVLNYYVVRRDEKPISMLTLSEWILRESAVRVVLGEFRQKEAAAFIDTTQQGTSGLTTGHGGTCVQITNRLVDAYLSAMPSTTEASAYRKIHDAIGFYFQMRRYVEPTTRTESFRLHGIYEVLPTDGAVTDKHYRPIVRYRFDGWDPETHEAAGGHEVVGALTPGRYEDCRERSNYTVDMPADLRPSGVKGSGRRVSAPRRMAGAAPAADPAPSHGVGGLEIEVER